MAIIGTLTADDDENEGTGTGTTGAAPGAVGANVTQSGSSGFVGGGTGQGATTSVKSAGGAPSGNYTNLSQYLTANGDSNGSAVAGSAADTTGKAAENVVGQTGANANNAINTFGTDAGNEVTGAVNGVGVNQGVLSAIGANGQTVNQGMLANDKASGKADTVTSGTYTPGAVSYSGPNADQYGNVSGLTGTASDDQTAALGYLGTPTTSSTGTTYSGGSLGQAVGDANGGQSGATALLQEAYSPTGYTAGEQNLDAALAGGSGALGAASGVLSGAQGNYTNLMKTLGTQAATGATTAANTNTAYQNAENAANAETAATNAAYKTAASQYVAPKPAPAQSSSGGSGNGNGSPIISVPLAQGASSAVNAVKDGAPAITTAVNNASKNIGLAPTVGTLKTTAGQAATSAGNAVTSLIPTGSQGTPIIAPGASFFAPSSTPTGGKATEAQLLGDLYSASPPGTDVSSDVNNTLNAINNAGSTASNAVNNVGNAVASTTSKVTGGFMAHGGEVPERGNYSNLFKKLRK